MFDRQSYEKFLFDTGCVGFFDPPVVLKSGRPGHWYVNMRDALQTEETKYQLARFVYDFSREQGLEPDHFLGVPDGATSLGIACNSLIDYKPRSEIPAGVLRAGKKVHGDPKNKYSVGPLTPGKHVVLIEDATTTGGSCMEQILRLQELGIWVDCVVSCVSRYERAEGGRTVQDVLKRDYHVNYLALTNARTLLPQAVELLKPAEELQKQIEAYYEKFGVEPVKLL